MTGGGHDRCWGVLAHLFFHSYSWINSVVHAATVEAIKKSWTNSMCWVTLADKAFNYARKIGLSWKLEISSTKEYGDLLLMQVCYASLTQFPIPKLLPGKFGDTSQKTLLKPTLLTSARPHSASEQQGHQSKPWCHWPAKPPRSERSLGAFHGVPDRRWSCTASLCSHTCGKAEQNITTID